MFSRQHGEDNLLDWVQLVCLRDDAYDWAALRTGFGVLKDAWMRFQRKHPRAPENVVAALRTLMSRIRPCADEATIAEQMDEMLQAYKAEWDDSVDVASDEDMHSPAPCTPERVPRINDVKVLDSPELNQRISEWQTLDLRSPSPRPSTAAQSSWEVPSDQVSTERVAEDKVETALPWTPVAVSPRTERLFMEQSMGDPCANSPIRGNESPRHLLFKKWYRQETWVDPELVRDSDLEVISNDSVLSEDAGSLSPAGSAVPRPPLSRTLAQVQPGRNRNFKFGSCPYHNCARSAFVFGPNAAPERRGRPYVLLDQIVGSVCFASRLLILS